MTPSTPQQPARWQPAWAIVAVGLPLAALVGGCLGSQRIPSEATSGVIHQPLVRPATDPTRVALANVPPSWRPSRTARRWDSIVLHHTAAEAGSVESIHADHRRRTTQGKPWLGIGYHFVIGNGKGMPDGAIRPTFRWRDQLHGAHAGQQAHNQHGIGIALIGHFDRRPPTPGQLASLRRLIGYLRTAHAIPAKGLIGHGDIKSTACPGKLFPLATLKREFAGGGITP